MNKKSLVIKIVMLTLIVVIGILIAYFLKVCKEIDLERKEIFPNIKEYICDTMTETNFEFTIPVAIQEIEETPTEENNTNVKTNSKATGETNSKTTKEYNISKDTKNKQNESSINAAPASKEVQTNSNVETTNNNTEIKEKYWCYDGGKQHTLGNKSNEHGYYKTWDAAWEACKSYMKDMASGNYYVDECDCGLYYFYVKEN